MIKTEFMKLCEKLNKLTEGVEDIDFKALTAAETEATRLEKEIRELEKEYSSKVYTAVNANEQYTKFRAELHELHSQLDELKHTYERRKWFRVGVDECEHEDWIDEEAYEKVKDRVEELYAAIERIKKEMTKVETVIEKQFEADKETIKTKSAEKDLHKNTVADIKSKLKQITQELKPELQAVADYLNEQEGKEVWKVAATDIAFDNKEQRLIASLYTSFTSRFQNFDTDDFDYDDSGDLKDSVAEDAALSAAESEGYLASQLIDAFELEQSDEGWHKIPGSNWELLNEDEAYPTDTPYFRVTRYYDATYWEPADWDYEEGGELVVEAVLYLGKKVHKAANEAVELDEARSSADIEAEILRLQQELVQAQEAEKRASYGGNFPTELWYWDMYTDPRQKGTWTSIENDLVFETEDEAYDAAYCLLRELDDEDELFVDPDDYIVDVVKIPLTRVSEDALEHSGLSHLIK